MKKNKHPKKDNLRLWGIYHGIKKRCGNPNCPRYKDYGGRGIKMCEAWLNGFDVFADWAKANGYTDELTIDRIDVNGDYSPENCRWSTRAEQANNRRGTLHVEYQNETKPLALWCKELGLTYDTMHDRIYKRGWSVERAFETKSMQEESFARVCREHDVKPSVVSDRVRKLGWTMEEALSIKPKGLGANQTSYMHAN